MATLAITPKLSIVDVIPAVTSVAALRQTDAMPDLFPVTGMAVDALVPSIQTEIRAGIMVELPQ